MSLADELAERARQQLLAHVARKRRRAVMRAVLAERRRHGLAVRQQTRDPGPADEPKDVNR